MVFPKSILITGCNRGIGLGLVKEFLRLGNDSIQILATCRDKSKADQLMSLESSNGGRPKVLELEVAHYENDYKDFAQKVEKELGSKGLNLLINNAGTIGERQNLESVSGDNMMEVFRVNCVGPTLLTRALLPFLQKAVADNPKADIGVEKAVVVQMSTAVASIAENAGGGNYAYRCSKSALNMSMKNTSIELAPQGILVMAMHPGWVLTDMGGPNAMIPVDECVSTMVKTIQQLGDKDQGAFLRYNNTNISW
uniref:C-factor n=1 Tax=Caligus clemensi TaxID=344056 RepID=C1C321_CALCM|nr:C-factor [Caligus clemensi]